MSQKRILENLTLPCTLTFGFLIIEVINSFQLSNIYNNGKNTELFAWNSGDKLKEILAQLFIL